MRIALGSDHIGYPLKIEIMKYLEELNIEFKDYGTDNTERCNYPEYGYKTASAVVSDECDRGIVVCGSGIGISIAANKVKGIRCVVCSEPYSAMFSRMHNNTNMLAMGARVVGVDLARMIVKSWLDAEFEGGRHQMRVEQISRIEEEGHL